MDSEDLFADDQFGEDNEPDLDPDDVLAEEEEEEQEKEGEDGENERDEEHADIANETSSETTTVSAPGTSKDPTANKEQTTKLLQLPYSRVRNLMKLDPDLNLASNEAIFVVARATELFIESFAREAYTYTTQAKKKTIQKKDIDLAIEGVDSLLFLDGAMNF